ncbi:alpha-1,3-mannosyltransferase ALG2 [Ephemerocybe angulata]|uniref:Alpha-1,3/1,6-mannosyltransferase ALG2 n=1 Tax=Ephemerocybe angulata TaxID=980116 RepID=A0A8H6I4T8_9AGAR|nr:alpha-1,3-mannosyltransferase ALG2 [Tulosesus angulatus]
MSSGNRPLRVAFIHPDLGIGGAERLVVDAAIGLQERGHSVDIYTSHHNPDHCFEETKNGTLKVHHVVPPFPRSFKGKLHILFAHLRQLHLIYKLLQGSSQYDVYFVDQLSTCIPFLRAIGGTRVVFYCHFPDKLLASGAFVEGNLVFKRQSLIKRLYRLPMDWLEEVTTRQADIILANSKFTARVFKTYFPTIPHNPTIVYPGINLDAYQTQADPSDPNVAAVLSNRPTLISLNRFEGKKNIALALESFAKFKSRGSHPTLRLVLAGGYDPRLEDNQRVLSSLQSISETLSLSYTITSPSPLPPDMPATPFVSEPDVLILLNFTTPQRTALLQSPSTLALLYTPENEHFGIVPIEAMACGVPVLACDSGGPLESILSLPPSSSPTSEPRTGWLRRPDPETWADALEEILTLTPAQRKEISETAKQRAKELFGMDAMAKGLEGALEEAVSMGPVTSDEVWGVWWKAFVMLVGFLLAFAYSSGSGSYRK